MKKFENLEALKLTIENQIKDLVVTQEINKIENNL